MYTIHPILNGVLTSTKEALTYRVDAGIPISFPVLSFLLEPATPGANQRILVDTGVKSENSAFLQRYNRTVGPPGGGPTPLRNGLEEHGVTPADIDLVVLTHLHHDHASNNDLFPSAEFLVQQTELAAARDPLPVFERSYPQDTITSLDQHDVTVLDGDYRINDSIELLLTPGHSAGMQSVIVETSRTRYALVGDLAYNRHNLDPRISAITDANGNRLDVTSVDADYLPPGTHIDVPACYESMERIREVLGDHGEVIPSHDPSVVDRTFPETA